jgi:hypothetical protein
VTIIQANISNDAHIQLSKLKINHRMIGNHVAIDTLLRSLEDDRVLDAVSKYIRNDNK